MYSGLLQTQMNEGTSREAVPLRIISSSPAFKEVGLKRPPGNSILIFATQLPKWEWQPGGETPQGDRSSFVTTGPHCSGRFLRCSILHRLRIYPGRSAALEKEEGQAFPHRTRHFPLYTNRSFSAVKAGRGWWNTVITLGIDPFLSQGQAALKAHSLGMLTISLLSISSLSALHWCSHHLVHTQEMQVQRNYQCFETKVGFSLH